MIAIQTKLNSLPDQVALLQINDHKTLAERKLLIVKLIVCYGTEVEYLLIILALL